jgi:hypothetical protein
MSVVSEQTVQHCDRGALHQQVVEFCEFESIAIDPCRRALEFSWRRVRGWLPAWQEAQFLRAWLSSAIGS